MFVVRRWRSELAFVYIVILYKYSREVHLGEIIVAICTEVYLKANQLAVPTDV